MSLSTPYHVALPWWRLKNTSLNYSVVSGKLNMAISRAVLLTFMTVNLLQFRLGDTQAEQYLVNIWAGASLTTRFSS